MDANIIVVLHRPQRVSNIGAAVRAMKNMGLRRLRLVRPTPFEPADILGIAHRSDDVIAAMEVFDTLDAALADAVFVAGTTARPRAAMRHITPREAAPDLLARATSGPVALLFGPEDNGLANEDLDRCHLALSVPTDPAYSSLNLAQAVLLVGYELRLAATRGTGEPRVRPAVRPATAAELEALFAAAERALWGVEFFKAHLAEGMLRTLRALVHRAEPDAREVRLLTAMCVETLRFIERKGWQAAENEGPKTNEQPPAGPVVE